MGWALGTGSIRGEGLVISNSAGLADGNIQPWRKCPVVLWRRILSPEGVRNGRIYLLREPEVWAGRWFSINDGFHQARSSPRAWCRSVHGATWGLVRSSVRTAMNEKAPAPPNDCQPAWQLFFRLARERVLNSLIMIEIIEPRICI